MLRRSLLTTAVAFIAGTLAPTIPAIAGNDPASLINSLGSQFQIVARSPSEAQKVAQFGVLFREDFDVPGLGRFVLGRFARFLTPSEQQQFLNLFETYVVYTYTDRLSDFAADGAALRVTGSQPFADGAIVSSEVIRDDRVQPIKIDWRLNWRDGMYKIADIVIDGLSMAVSGRSDLEGVVERNGGQPQVILGVLQQDCQRAARQL
jgi:phospholipid transport system substrate-binding protein